MYPIINISDDIIIHTFGIFLLIAGAVFFSLLHFFSLKKGIVQHIFSDLFSFILTPFILGRIFHIIAEWRDEKFIFMDLIEWKGFLGFLSKIFLTANYNLSFAGCVLWFLIVFFIKTRKNKADRPIYYDIIIPAFLGAAVIGYLWAFLGGQIYGIPYDGLFSIIYNTKESIVPLRNGVFPLPFLYIFWIILIGVYLFKIFKKSQSLPDWFLGYLGFWLFGILLFLGEFLNGSSDMISSSFLSINFTQIIGIYFIGFAFLWLGKSLKIENL